MVDIDINNPQELFSYNMGHMPIIAHWCDRLQLNKIFDDNLGRASKIPPSVVVKAMVLDTLHGRSPLYHLERTFEDTDNELLFGKPYHSHDFNDDGIGRTLDSIQAYGCEKLYTELTLNALETFSLDTTHAHYDTTSVNVWGAYEHIPAPGKGPNITHGYSKDKRPDLKQLMMDLVCVEGNIPILGRTKDGNSSDEKLNNEILMKLRDYCDQAGRKAGLYVADSKLVTEDNLTGPLNGKEFVTRLPATHGVHDKVIHEALKEGNWQELGTLSESESKNPKRPSACYKVCEKEVTLYGKSFRAIVVHTTAKDKRKTKALASRILKEQQELSKALKRITKETFSCQNDCENGMNKLLKKAPKFHAIEAKVVPTPIFSKGRLKEGADRGIERYDYHIAFELTRNEEKIKKQESICGCFVLIASKETAQQGPKELLLAYKGQSGVETNFRFIKDPIIVNDLFLKKATRIESLGLILLISLLVYNLIQRSMRQYVQEKDTELIGFDNKKTRKPTTYMLYWAFKSFMVIKQGNSRVIGSRKKEDQRQFLQSMHMDFDIFTEPCRHL